MIYNFYHITDVHYYSKRNFKCDWKSFPQPSTQICILKSEEAFRKALETIKNDEDTKTVMFLGRKLNGLTYAKVAKFSKKYHDLKESDYADKKDRKFVDLIMEMISNLYRGNAPYSPDTVEYKITMGSFRKIEKLLSSLRIDSRKLLSGYTLSEFIEPLLYNSGLDDDNVTVTIN